MRMKSSGVVVGPIATRIASGTTPVENHFTVAGGIVRTDGMVLGKGVFVDFFVFEGQAILGATAVVEGSEPQIRKTCVTHK
jgi:hypothetical protein